MKNTILALLVVFPSILFSQTKDQLKLVEKFKETSNDSMFLVKHSADGFRRYDVVYENEHGILDAVDSIVFNGNEGEVLGPFYSDSYYLWVKVQKVESDYLMSAGNIYINSSMYQDDSAEIHANYIFKLAQTIAFDSLCRQYSDDSNNHTDCGIGYFTESMMAEPFGREVKNHKKGDIFMVKTMYGWHVVKVLDDHKYQRLRVFGVSLYLKNEE